MTYERIIVDEPAPMVRRITLNNPDKRNPLGAKMRREIMLGRGPRRSKK